MSDPKNKDLLVPLKPYKAVQRARQALLDDAYEIYTEYRQGLKLAIANGKFAEGLAGYQWLISHMPRVDGDRILDMDIDKQEQVETTTKAPAIQIVGIALGGVTPKKQLEAPVEAELIDSDD